MQPQDNASPETNPTPPAASPPSPQTPDVSAPTAPTPDVQAPAQPAAPVSGIVVGGQGGPQAAAPSAEPLAPTGSTITPDATTSAAGTPPPAPVAPPAKPKRSKKGLIIIIILLLLLIGGAAAFYFGYYKNPQVMLGKAMVNTGKGYDKLVDYYNQQSSASYKGATLTGSFTLKSAEASADGDMTFKADDKNLQGTVNLNLMGTKASADIVAIDSPNSDMPDLYLKTTNAKQLAALAGSPEITTLVTGLDGKWIVADHTLLDTITAAATQQQAAAKQSYPTKQQIVSEANAFGEVNKQYIFTDNKNKAIANITKQYGAETIDGHNTYHYQMTLNKTNVKAYISAQQAALKSSKLNDWIKANGYEDAVSKQLVDMQKSADKITSKDTFQLWIDTDAKLLYKVRIPDEKNPVTNYLDAGLGYKGGSDYPFFLVVNDKEGKDTTNTSLKAVLNTSTNIVDLKFGIKSTGSTTADFNANLKYKPTSEAVKITAPTGAIPVTQVLTQLGIPLQ